MTVLPWDLPDGIEVHRLANSHRGQRAVYSVQERGTWWTDRTGRRRSWSSSDSVQLALAQELMCCPGCGQSGHWSRLAQAPPRVCDACSGAAGCARARPATREDLRAWTRSAPEGATLGDGARHFGITVDRFLAIRDRG